jgi:WD40 repeat protein
MHGHSGYVSSLVLQDDYLISASYDSTLCLWSATRQQLLKQIKAHEHCVNALMTHDSGVLLSASWDGTVRLWDLRINGSAQTRSFASVLTVPVFALPPLPPLCVRTLCVCTISSHRSPGAAPCDARNRWSCDESAWGAGARRGAVLGECGAPRVLRPA